MTQWRVLTLAASLIVVSPDWAQAGGESPKPAAPRITGAWTGMWWPHPPTPLAAPKLMETEAKRRLDCTVVQKGNLWEATFEGECGRPYKFTIKMDGRQAGEAVLFKGTTDLGEENGGVFDWIARATERGFIGFFTSAKYAGEFRLER